VSALRNIKHLAKIGVGIISFFLAVFSFASGPALPSGVQRPVTKAHIKNDSIAQKKAQHQIRSARSQPYDSENKYLKATTVRQEAFSQVPQSLMPMTPDQIKLLKRIYDKTEEAKTYIGRVPPKPTSSTIVVDLSPGATPPVLRMAKGFVSSIVFLDSTGAPWPIRGYDIGDGRAFDVQWRPGNKDEIKKGVDISNTMLIQANTVYQQVNMAIMLQGLNTPVMVTLVSGQKVVDYRTDVHIPRDGPLAKATGQMMPGSADPILMDVLSNIPPSLSKSVKVTGGDATIWALGGYFYVRTPLTLVSPSWVSTMSSSDGMMKAYKTPEIGVLLVLEQGSLKQLKAEGY
jgi:intracellular multiplication protein IcmK